MALLLVETLSACGSRLALEGASIARDGEDDEGDDNEGEEEEEVEVEDALVR